MTEANRRPRCTEPGCPVRYRGGPDRACPLHQQDADGDTLAARMAAMAEVMAAPGDHASDGAATAQ